MVISPNKWELDVQGYLNTCNITDSTPRKQIRDFAAGVNDLGLWNSMVCWPLRSTQNYGSGTTAFSLGGLGTYNGTLVNGPSWETNGFTNTATGHITTNYFEVGGSQAHIFVGNTTTTSVTRTHGGTLSNSNTKGMRFRDDAVLFGDGALKGSSNLGLTDAGNFKMAAALYNRPSASPIFLNSTQVSSLTSGNAIVAGENSLTLLAAQDGGISQYYSGQAAFYATIRAALTSDQYLALYTLYEQTLGTGLGLP